MDVAAGAGEAAAADTRSALSDSAGAGAGEGAATLTGSWHCFFLGMTLFSSKMTVSRDLFRPRGDLIGLLRGEPGIVVLLCSWRLGDIALTFASRGARARLLAGDEGFMVSVVYGNRCCGGGDEKERSLAMEIEVREGKGGGGLVEVRLRAECCSCKNKVNSGFRSAT